MKHIPKYEPRPHNFDLVDSAIDHEDSVLSYLCMVLVWVDIIGDNKTIYPWQDMQGGSIKSVFLHI